MEHASFIPLVLEATGGLANEANFFYKRLAPKLTLKWDHSYSSTLCWLRCRLTFSLLHSSEVPDHHVDIPYESPTVIDLASSSETNTHQIIHQLSFVNPQRACEKVFVCVCHFT